MKLKNLFKWPKEIYIFWLAEFLLGIDLMGPVLLIFFKDWGGLNQTQIQSLQSWFMLWIFILEIPTGVFGDVKGKKFSVIFGFTLSIIATFLYSIVPNIWMFALGEFIFALGAAFVSGAMEAWLYDISKDLKAEEKFRDISVIKSNLHILGMIVAAIIFAPISQLLPIEQIFRLRNITALLAILLLGIFVHSTDGKREKSLKPDYIGIAKKGLKMVRDSVVLKRLTLYITILSSTSYFVIWLYQELLNVLNVDESLFGIYRIALLVAEIMMLRVGAYLLNKFDKRKVYVLIALIVAIGFLLAAIFQNIFGVISVLVLAGGIGLQVQQLLSKDINEYIDSEQRATVLSFISMIRRLSLTLFNPLIGYLVDSKGVFIAFGVLAIVSLIAVFFKPKFNLK
jgi:MFS family permease